LTVDWSSFLQTVVLGLGTAGLYASVASGLTLEFGVMRIINFAHGEFVMIGAFITYFLYTGYGIPPLLGMLVAGGAIGLLSWIVFKGFLAGVLKQDEHNQLLATLGLSIVLLNLAAILWTPNARAMRVADILPSLRLGAIVLPGNNLLVALLGVMLVLALMFIKNRTALGLQMRLASDDPELASFAGLDVNRTYGLAFVIGGITAGIAGGLVALVLYVQPTVGTDLVVRAFAIIALGGLGSISGVLLGAIILALAEQMTSTFIANGASWGYGVAFLMIVLVLVFRPTGLFGRAAR
jgi:branched-chain amino acid transport system permease protein